MGQTQGTADRCPRCRSQHHTDCYNPDQQRRFGDEAQVQQRQNTPLPQEGGEVNGRPLLVTIIISVVVVGAIVFGLRAIFIP